MERWSALCVQVCYPKRTDKAIYCGLVTQLETLGVQFVGVDHITDNALVTVYDVVIDALFGFSFSGEPRDPFDQLLEVLNPYNSPPPIVAVDIPSGWSVDEGDVSGVGMRPELLAGAGRRQTPPAPYHVSHVSHVSHISHSLTSLSHGGNQKPGPH